MRKIVWSFFAIALILSAASCQDNGLDANYSNSTLTITATIVEPETSRMGYAFPDNNIQPTWADGDQVFGFDSEGNNFTFEVESVTDGRATMTVVGKYTPVNGRTIYAMFVPGKSVANIADNKVAIELDTQNNVNNPSVILCATSIVSENTVNLGFRYQTAVVGVKQFKIPETSVDVTSLKLVGAKAQGTIKVEGGELKLVPADGMQTITASPATSWTANGSGIVSTPVYFMVIPTVDAELELQATTGTANYVNLSHIGEDGLDIEAGHYYYMSKNLATPVAQVGREKYTTIDAAWAAANAATSDVTVTLLANCTAAAQLALNNTGTGAVTLNLNNKILTTVSNNHGISIGGSRSLTVSNDGTIKNVGAASSEKYVIYNEGTLTINNGTITSDYRAIRSNGTASVSAGTIESTNSVTNAYAFYNTGALTVTGGVFTAKRYPLFNSESSSTADISGGTFSSTHTDSGGAAIRAYNGIVSITGGLFSMSYSAGELFTVSSGKVYVTGGCFDRPIIGTMTRTAPSEGNYAGRNALNSDDDTKAEYPYTAATGTRYYQVDINGSTYYHNGLPSARHQAISASNDVTITLLRASSVSSSYDLTNADHTITLDLNGNTITSSGNSLITTSGRLVITSGVAGGTITGSKNNIISITNKDADVTISNCKIVSTCEAGSSAYTTRTIYHTLGNVGIENATIISENATALYSYGGTMAVSGSTITSHTYGLYASNGADVTLSGTDNSFYSEDGRCVYVYTSTAKVALEGGYYYSYTGNAISCRNATDGADSYTITGGYFSQVNSNLVKSTGYENIVTLLSPEPHNHDADHTGLSYTYGYQAGEGAASLDEPVANYGGAQTGINF